MAINTSTTTLDICFAERASIDELLVDLHDAQRRYATSTRYKATMNRQRVVHTVAQILETEVNPHEKTMVADVLMSLVRQAERDLRESLSERLCVINDAPEDLILYLAHDIISVAKPVLSYSPILTETDLLYIIQSKSPEYWQAIAQRKKLDSDVVDALVERKDEGTAVQLVNNDTIRLNITAIEAFAELSKYSESLAEPLLRRSELPKRIAMDLYWHVSAVLRSQINQSFNIPKEKLDEALQDALQDFSDTAHKTADPRPSALMMDLARQYSRLNRIDDAMLVKTLRRGHTRFFVALMAERSNLAPETIHEIMRQVGGQGMAVACKAIHVTKENFVSLFLLSRSLTRGECAVDAYELRKAIKYFDAISADFAASIMANTIIKK
jgi:uncharacterized protein (DUF2336 family)